MSDFTVLRSLDGYCLVLDKKRIAGGKPDYRGENVLVDWTTEVAYGPVDDLAAENAKLRELVRDMEAAFIHGPCYRWCEFKEPCNGGRCQYRDRMRELGVDV